ncbi:MAG: RdgB/HAM1 family non-canonical purine NTP pyrophosphatase [Ignavibacteria bacterium]|nr:RdgB/HAM1 family non-canonical purine NTP pyrophosphatase [Ignavibacteria bacterium]
MKILVATNNKNKQIEILDIFRQKQLQVELIFLQDVSSSKIEISEEGATIEENALLKAKGVYDIFSIPTIADDTALEVESIGALPGVHTARFAGAYATDEENRTKLLNLLEGMPIDQRKARFRTIICYYDGNSAKFFEGVCEGKISTEERGSKGFGYDPIFIPSGYEITFAEMELEEKNRISHRAKAVENFVKFLKEKLNKNRDLSQV